MIKVFIDTNILIDCIDARTAFVDDAIRILGMAEREDVRLYASALSFSNIAYIMRKRPLTELKEVFKNLCVIMDVIPVDNVVLQKAIESQFSDFEDALQYFCAESGQCDYLITRNVNDFVTATDTVSVLTPTQFLEIMK